MSTMRAVRFHGNQDLRVEEIPVAPVGPDQVKIAPEWCGLCGSGTLHRGKAD
jgi:threonine dehydrogenase-like Zn-dependent dehydrogenase